MEAKPNWFKAIKPLMAIFDKSSQNYVFSGPLLNLSTASLVKLNIPSDVLFGGKAKNSVDIHLDVNVHSPLDASAPTGTLTGSAKFVFLGGTLAEVPPGGNFNFGLHLKPQDLKIIDGNISFSLSGSKHVNLFPNKTFESKGLGIKYTSSVFADVDYSAVLTVMLNEDGTLNGAASTLDFSMNSTLSGTVSPELNLLNPTLNKLLKDLGKINVPQAIIGEITDALQGLGVLPTVNMTANVTGNINIAGKVQLKGSPTSSTPKLVSSSVRVHFVPTVIIGITWLNDAYPLTESETISHALTIDRTF